LRFLLFMLPPNRTLEPKLLPICLGKRSSASLACPAGLLGYFHARTAMMIPIKAMTALGTPTAMPTMSLVVSPLPSPPELESVVAEALAVAVAAAGAIDDDAGDGAIWHAGACLALECRWLFLVCGRLVAFGM
jgi:hypothetical protein